MAIIFIRGFPNNFTAVVEYFSLFVVDVVIIRIDEQVFFRILNITIFFANKIMNEILKVFEWIADGIIKCSRISSNLQHYP